jgi:hypothetical protein
MERIMKEIWIYGTSGNWHLSRERELRGIKTGTVLSRYRVAACTGRPVGGAYGYSTHEGKPGQGYPICQRCESLAAKALRD